MDTLREILVGAVIWFGLVWLAALICVYKDRLVERRRPSLDEPVEEPTSTPLEPSEDLEECPDAPPAPDRWWRRLVWLPALLLVAIPLGIVVLPLALPFFVAELAYYGYCRLRGREPWIGPPGDEV